MMMNARMTKDENEIWALPNSGSVSVRVVHVEVGWPLPMLSLPKRHGLVFPLFRINDYEVITPGLPSPEGLPKRSESEILNDLLQRNFESLSGTDLDSADFGGFLVKASLPVSTQYHMGLVKLSEGWTGRDIVWNFAPSSALVFQG